MKTISWGETLKKKEEQIAEAGLDGERITRRGKKRKVCGAEESKLR